MLESQIEEWLNKKIKEIGGLSFKWVSPGNPGVPDRIYVFPNNQVYFVELKTESGRLSNIQKWQRQRLKDLGVNYRLVKGMQEAKEFVKELKDEVYTPQLSEVRNQ